MKTMLRPRGGLCRVSDGEARGLAARGYRYSTKGRWRRFVRDQTRKARAGAERPRPFITRLFHPASADAAQLREQRQSRPAVPHGIVSALTGAFSAAARWVGRKRGR